jgi:hypothetical protein
MQYVSDQEGEGWRDTISRELKRMGIIIFNPYHKPFVRDIQESGDVRKKLYKAMKRRDYDFLSNKVHDIRIYDLNLVDRSDFLIAFIDPTVPSWGSVEELVTAVRMKKPIFLAVKGGKHRCPYWIFGMFPHRYIYDSVEDIVKMLKRIDSGKKKMDSDRWKLLRKEFR